MSKIIAKMCLLSGLGTAAVGLPFFGCVDPPQKPVPAIHLPHNLKRHQPAIKPLYPVRPTPLAQRYTLVGQRTAPAKPCPTPLPASGGGGQWLGTPLLDIDEDAKLPRGARGMCVYEWSPAQGAPPSPRSGPLLPSPSQFSPPGLVRDFIVSAPQASEVPASALDALGAAFFARLGHTALDATANLQAVRIAVVDTWPTSEPATAPSNWVKGFPTWADGRSAHGFNMIGVAQGLVGCPAPPATCPISTASHLGLPRTDSGSLDTSNGGYAGTKADLARGIHQAIKSWKSTASSAKLVINLSVGWEPSAAALDPCGKNQRDGQTVYDALNRATCAGALVIAAAGNTQGTGAGAVCPARWASEMVGCAGYSDISPGNDAAGIQLPLLYAVSAIDYGGKAASGHRPDSWPQLAVLGHQGLAFDGTMAPQGAMSHTGTSVSAASLSAIAARRWAAAGSAVTAQALMQSLYSGGALLRAGGVEVPTNLPPGSSVRCVSVGSPAAGDCAASAKNPLLVSPASSDLKIAFDASITDGGVSLSGTLIEAPSALVVPQPRTGCGICFAQQREADALVNILFTAEPPDGTSSVQVDVFASDDSESTYYLSPPSAWQKDVGYQFTLSAVAGLPGASLARVTLIWSYLGQLDSQVIMLQDPES